MERGSDVERLAIEHAAYLLEAVTLDGFQLEREPYTPGRGDEINEDPEYRSNAKETIEHPPP